MEKRKVRILDEYSGECIVILTDATREQLFTWIGYYNQEYEKGEHYALSDSLWENCIGELQKACYAKILYNYGRDPEEDLEAIGFDETYNTTYEVKKAACKKPYYFYTGPMDTRDGGGWKDGVHTPEGSLNIIHPDIQMSCQVTDTPSLPGFRIKCRDNGGAEREFQLFLNVRAGMFIVCTGNETDKRLPKDDWIHKNYPIPFENVTQ